MSGRIYPHWSRCVVFALIAAFILSGLPVSFSKPTAARPPRMKSNKMAEVAAAPVVFQAAATSFDKLIQDDSSGSMLRFNSSTGEYLFSRCSDGFTLSGTGSVIRRGCTYTLTHNPSDRRVQATLDTCTRKANASLQFPVGTTAMTITDRDISNDPGLSDASAPQVSIDAPNGGEIVDTGSSFTINWNVTDNVSVSSQDVQISTNGGSTFSTVAAGLAGNVNQYQWTAPVSVNNQQVRVRVIARDSACNVSRDDSDSNFTLWNPPASFTHTAEAPVYMVSGGFNAYIHLCNTSLGTVIVELALRKPSGEATAHAPAQVSLAAGEVRKIKVADYLTLPSADEMVEGSIRLRHNGPSDSAVQAMIAVDKSGEEQSFTAPFVYATSSQSAQSTMQCSPLFYIGDETHAYLALQNCRNYPVKAGVKINYGTGEAGGPNGSYYLPELTLGGQRRLMIDLADFKEELGGAEWGSIVITAPSQSVAAHTVMKSSKNHLAFGSAFIDPSLSVSTTKVGSALKLDYATGLKSCVMVCNTSAQERVVTVSFMVTNGVVVADRQVRLGPGGQQMIELDSRQLLSAGQSAMADVRLSYSGSGSDILAGAVSMSPQERCSIAARFTEPAANDGHRLMSPFFRFDARTQGLVQVSNLGATAIRAGVSMTLANTAAPAINSELITVAAGRTATINLQNYIDRVPDGVAAEGCLMLVHNGQPGTVTASFTAIGTDNDIALDSPLTDEGDMTPRVIVVFPGSVIIQPGDTTPIAIITEGGAGPFTFGATEGTVTPVPDGDPEVEEVDYTAPDDDGDLPEIVTITVTSPTGIGTIQLEVQKVKLDGIETFNAQNQGTEGRINPDGGTTFVLTGRRDFPPVPLVVRFKQGSLKVEASIPVDSASRPTAAQLKGTAPANTKFVGDAQIEVRAEDGKRISKKTLCDETGCSAYYAFDPPSPATSVSGMGFNRLGGNLTITAAAGGFKQFRPSDPNTPRVNPDVDIGDLEFAVNLVGEGAPSTINGNVKRAGSDVRTCNVEGETPCKFIDVKNPGGKKRDRVRSLVALYNLLPGPPPVPLFLSRNSGRSIGGTEVTVEGEDLDFVKDVVINSRKATINQESRTRTRLKFTTPGNCIGTFAVVFKGVDGLDAMLSGFTYLHTLSGTRPFEEGAFDLTVTLGGKKTTEVLDPIIIGPCEVLTITPLAQEARCLKFRVKVDDIVNNGQARAYLLRLEADASTCDVSNVPSPVPFTFFFELINGPERRTGKSSVDIRR